MFKRRPTLTEQAKSYIKQRILNNEFADGRIPSEIELATELGVSRTTIRDALSRLELEGVIYRKQGAGTFINKAGLQIKTRLEDIWDYETMLEAHGYTPAIRILSVEEKTDQPEIAASLGLPPDASLVIIQKLFLADKEPVIVTLNYIPTDLITRPYTADDFLRPMYEFLPHFSQQRLAYYLSDIIPMIAPGWLVELLNLPRQKNALICFEETAYNQDHEPILRANSYFRDDLLRLRLIRSQGE